LNISGVFLLIIFQTLFINTFLNYLWAAFLDPGFIANMVFSFDFIRNFERKPFFFKFPPKDLFSYEELKNCYKCPKKPWKPPRAHHCRICKSCVFRVRKTRFYNKITKKTLILNKIDIFYRDKFFYS